MLREINPSSPSIHPKDRVSVKASRFTRSSGARVAKNKRTIIESSEEDNDQSEDDFDESEADEDEDEKSAVPPRRSARTSNEKKTYVSARPVNARGRAASAKKRGAYAEIDEDYDDDQDDDDNDQGSQLKKHVPKVLRGRLSYPAYGNIRGVADLSDDESGDEEAVFHAHRNNCEKCQQPPAHELLKEYYKKGKGKGKGKKRGRPREVDEFEEDDDEERFLNLGGWVRW